MCAATVASGRTQPRSVRGFRFGSREATQGRASGVRPKRTTLSPSFSGAPGGRGSPVGAVALELLTAQPKPVAVVPAGTAHPGRLGRILFPLEGTRSTSLAPRRTIELALDAGLEIVLVHVFDAASLPSFTDQPQHETAAWAGEFLARYFPHPPEDVRLESRVGDPAEHVVSVAHEIDADLVALGWEQELAPGRARVVRAALEQARLPVFLIPIVSVDGERAETESERLVSGGATAAPGNVAERA
ncbi:MAG: universal stress protein [Gaiellaceae bacterium]